ncbi:hypothetical protein G3U99_23385 [Vibrio coralliilyticus OCN008]|uniref:hypothetical protein n=1 Tax=Vibrio coralliilyticus TaxID=190893 RepID=UPI0013F45882|nr:hypothetical protein [Vibrio coralliilyticus]QIJ87177.1 hypothetical protein G3U99_23385 [Vibrio coralliilyticus OCN008]
MKMNLSVVMGMKDKISAPLKGISSESDHYAKVIKKVQKAQADDTAALGMIASFKSSQKAISKNALAIAATNEKLTELKAKAASTTRPSAALTEKISKQQDKLDKLNAEQTSYKNNLVRLGKQLSQTGVKMYDLEGESDRLNRSYKKHGQEIARLSKKYSILQGAMKPIQKLNGAIRLPNVASATVGKGAALLGGVSLAGLVSEVNSTADEMDKLAKVAGNLNLPIEELQAMQSQANHAGVESDALSGSMLRFTKRLGVLQETGTGALGSFLKKSGNSLHKDLQGAEDTQQAYEMLLDTFSKLESPQKQMAFADAAFGQDGRKMLIMLREGTQGLTAARKELNALGGGATAEDAAKAEAYNDALQKIQESVRSMKFAALAPVMEKVTKVFTRFSDKFKNVQWRTEFIEKLIQTVDGLYRGFAFLGKGLIWVTQNFKGIVAALAIFKVAMIGLNAVIMANPIGMIVAAVGAAIIAITYLVDKFVGLDKVIKWVGEKVGWLWNKFKALINKLPDSLIPEGWKIETEQAGKQVDNLASKLDGIKNKNAKLGITTEETTNRRETTSSQYHAYQAGNLTAPKQYQAYQPLTSQTLKSKSEVELRIKSDKPVTVDKAKSEKGTELNLDVGSLGWSY